METCSFALGVKPCDNLSCHYAGEHYSKGDFGWAKTATPDLSIAVKADEDKVRADLLPVGPMLAIAEVLTFGAKKYADHNWRKGFKWSRLLGAAMRHLFAFLRGEDKDPETGLSHLAHLGCCVMFLLEHEQRGLGEDDRYKS